MKKNIYLALTLNPAPRKSIASSKEWGFNHVGSRLGGPRAGRMPALQKLDVIKSPFLRYSEFHSNEIHLKNPPCPPESGGKG